MLDLSQIRKDPDTFRAMLASRGMSSEPLDAILALDPLDQVNYPLS